MNYYKATRPDGTDFYTGTINYAQALETGEVITHPVKPTKDEPSTYLSVSIAPADCTGMRWPCRLFRVRPIGRTLKASDLPNKRACKALRVVEELPAWQALGPNGEAVARHIERCNRTTEGEAWKLGAAWGGVWNAAWDAAVATAAARNEAWNAAWNAACGTAAARGAAWDAARNAAWGSVWGPAWATAAARRAAWNAAVALAVRDLITQEQFDTLYGPWRSVMGDEA